MSANEREERVTADCTIHLPWRKRLAVLLTGRVEFEMNVRLRYQAVPKVAPPHVWVRLTRDWSAQ